MSLVWSIVLVVGDASPAHLVLDTRVRGGVPPRGGRRCRGGIAARPLLRSAASSAGIVALGLLGLLAVLAPPHSSLWQDGGALASPVLAALAVTLAAPKPSRRPVPAGATVGGAATTE